MVTRYCLMCRIADCDLEFTPACQFHLGPSLHKISSLQRTNRQRDGQLMIQTSTFFRWGNNDDDDDEDKRGMAFDICTWMTFFTVSRRGSGLFTRSTRTTRNASLHTGTHTDSQTSANNYCYWLYASQHRWLRWPRTSILGVWGPGHQYLDMSCRVAKVAPILSLKIISKEKQRRQNFFTCSHHTFGEKDKIIKSLTKKQSTTLLQTLLKSLSTPSNWVPGTTDLYINNLDTGLASLSIANGDPFKQRWVWRGRGLAASAAPVPGTTVSFRLESSPGPLRGHGFTGRQNHKPRFVKAPPVWIA